MHFLRVFCYPKVHNVLFVVCPFLTRLIQTLAPSNHERYLCHLQTKIKSQLELLCDSFNCTVLAGAGWAPLESESNYPQKKYQTPSSPTNLFQCCTITEPNNIHSVLRASMHITNKSFKRRQQWCLFTGEWDMSPPSCVSTHPCIAIGEHLSFPFPTEPDAVRSYCSPVRNFKPSSYH